MIGEGKKIYIAYRNKSEVSYTVVFKTGKLIELDMASDALEAAGIPFYRQEESLSGIRQAMPAFPTALPGTWWSILVPVPFQSQAIEVLEGLPFERKTDPEIWDFNPPHDVKRGFQAAVIAALIFVMAWFILTILEAV